MVKHSSEDLDLIFRALADGTRRAMLTKLSKGEASVSELAKPFDMSLAAVSKHISVLEAARFVEKQRSGRVIRCKANLEPLGGVAQILEELGSHWQEQLNSLEAYLETENGRRRDYDGTKKQRKRST